MAESSPADFFTTEVWTWRGLVTDDTVLVIDLASRRVQIVGSSRIPTTCSCIKSLARSRPRTMACSSAIACWARAAGLDARVAIYSVNFGEASRHLEDARGLLGRANERLKGLGRDDAVKQVQTALACIEDAQRMAGKLDQSANARAGEAEKLLADVLDAEAKR